MNPLFKALDTSVKIPSALADIKPKKNDPAVAIAMQVLPALSMTAEDRAVHEKNATKTLKKVENVRRFRLAVSKKTHLDSIAFSASEKPMAERKIIVYFLPNYALWQEMVTSLAALRDNCQTDVICCNYRGCGQSEGFPLQDEYMIQDGVLQIQQLLANGAKPENIVVDGYSLGAAVALAVAEKLEAQKQVVRGVVNERSFSSIEAFVNSDPDLKEQLGENLVKDLGWGLSPETSIKKFSGSLLVIHNVKDKLITYPISLKGALDKQKVKNTKISFIAMEATKDKDQHSRDWTPLETETIYAAIRSLFKS